MTFKTKLMCLPLGYLHFGLTLFFACQIGFTQTSGGIRPAVVQTITISPNGTQTRTFNLEGVAVGGMSKKEQAVFDDLKATLSNPQLTAEEAYRACENFFTSKELLMDIGGLDQLDYRQIDDILNQNIDKSMAPFIKGCYYNRDAWQIRGSGIADSLKPVQISSFQDRTTKAEKILETAWALNTNQPLIANEMMIVELAQGKGRDRMELWFQRAMALDTNNHTACAIKLNYLQPRWYGSHEEMLAFGRQCLASTNWGGCVPLIIADAHSMIAGDYQSPSVRSSYWKHPAVWNDINTAYNKYLDSNPYDLGPRQQFTHFAYLSEKWDIVNEQLPLLGDVDFTIFGGKAAFDHMVELAKKHSSIH